MPPSFSFRQSKLAIDIDIIFSFAATLLAQKLAAYCFTRLIEWDKTFNGIFVIGRMYRFNF